MVNGENLSAKYRLVCFMWERCQLSLLRPSSGC